MILYYIIVEYIWFDYEDDEVLPGAIYGINSPRSPSRNQHTRSPMSPNNNHNNNNSPNRRFHKTGGLGGGGGGNPMNRGRMKRERQFDAGQDVLEGFVLSAGLDQRVYLWTLQGKCIGEFGTFSWNINNEHTWVATKQANARILLPTTGPNSNSNNNSNSSSSNANSLGRNKNAMSLRKKGNHQNGGSLSQTKVSSFSSVPLDPQEIEENRQLNLRKFDAQYITKDSILMVESPSSTFINTFVHLQQKQHKLHSTQEVHRYIDYLAKKVQNRPPAYQELDNQWKDLSVKYPISEPELPTKHDFQKMLKDLNSVIKLS
jgi:hypothetical protein